MTTGSSDGILTLGGNGVLLVDTLSLQQRHSKAPVTIPAMTYVQVVSIVPDGRFTGMILVTDGTNLAIVHTFAVRPDGEWPGIFS